MKEKKEEADSFMDFPYEKAPGHQVVYANGVHGGPTPRGDIIMDFFLERVDTPTNVRHKIEPGARLGEEIDRTYSTKPIVREVQVTVIMSPEQAESVSKWLQQRVAIIKDSQERKGSGDA